MPGPVPKSSEVRRRRNKPAGGEVEKRPGVASERPEPSEDWHPLAREWFLSLGQSGQRDEYQASDWASARIAAQVLSQVLAGELPMSSFESWAKLNTALLGTVGDRRRARLELTGAAPEAKAARTSSRDRLKVV